MSQAATAPAPYRFTREEYHRMGEAGLFVGKRVELLDGAIITMSPQRSPHAAAVTRAVYALIRVLGSSFLVRSQLPIVLDDWSEPEPDIAVCQPDPGVYMRAHPTPGQILLVVEVAASSLAYDRGQKAAAYAPSAIPTYWVVNLAQRHVQVLSEPDQAAGRYTGSEIRTEGDNLSLPGGATVAVAEVLPPP
jgi:Uma2 family endonuclease